MKISLSFLFCLAFFTSFFFNGVNVLNALGYYDKLGPNMLSPTVLLFSILAILLYINSFVVETVFVIMVGVLLLMAFFLFLFKFTIFPNCLYTTFFMPIIICYCIDSLKFKLDKKKLLFIFYSFFLIECFLAIFERIFFKCVFPNLGFETYFNLGNELFRSYALYGHPLSNSGMILVMSSFILIYQKNLNKKFFYYALGVVAILCFNSRFAFILDLSFGGVYFFRYVSFISKSEWDKIKLIFWGLIAVFLVQRLISSGLGDRMIAYGIYDESSAGARIEIFDIFKGYTFFDFLVPVSYGQFYSMMQNYTHGIIENAWIILMFRYGLIWMIITATIYVILFKKRFNHVKKTDLFFLLIPWLLNISSSNSIANASIAIGQLFLFQFIMEGEKK